MADWLEWASEQGVWLESLRVAGWPVDSLSDVRAVAETETSQYGRKRTKFESGEVDPVFLVIEIATVRGKELVVRQNVLFA